MRAITEPDTAQAEIARVSAAPSLSKKMEDLAAKERERSEQKRLDFEGVREKLAEQDSLRVSRMSLRSQQDSERAAQRAKLLLKQEEEWITSHDQDEIARTQRRAARQKQRCELQHQVHL
mmetsp:Transcript_14478/g.23029  ORF Transcript_14478/g.23029 Transcript_14478/m.23029 type:complete len:120 (+) Transcript_14478:59-418(+)